MVGISGNESHIFHDSQHGFYTTVIRSVRSDSEAINAFMIRSSNCCYPVSVCSSSISLPGVAKGSDVRAFLGSLIC